MHRFFTALYYLISKNKVLSAVVAVGILVLCVFFASKLNFEEDINQIIPKSEKSDLTAKVLKQLNFSDKIIVIVEKKSKSEDFGLSETGAKFIEEIQPLKKYINSIQGKVNDDEISKTFDFVQNNLPLFLDENDYKTISQKLNSDSIAKKVEDNYVSLVSPTSLVTKEFIKKDPLGITFLGVKKLNALNISSDFKLEDNFVVSKDGKTLLLFIDPKFKSNDTKQNEAFVDHLNLIKDKLNKEFKGKTQLSYFGSPVIAVANAKQIKKDIQSTVIISFTLLLIVLIYYFRNFFTPIIIFIPTICAALISLLILYFIKDKISAISLSVAAILVGITIDYALHILTHYKHSESVEDLYKDVSQPIILSSVTTAVSFLCLVFVKSEALKDLGLFAALTVFLSSFLSLIIVPILYQPKKQVKEHQSNFIDKVSSYPYERNKYLIIGCSIIIFACLFGFSHVKFNNDIGSLNYVPEDLKISEKKLEKLSDITSKSIYTISYGKTQEEALQRNTKLTNFLETEKQQGKILSYNSIGNVVISKEDQQKRIAEWKKFWNPETSTKTLNSLENNGKKFGFSNAAFETFANTIHKDYSTLSVQDYNQLEALQLSEFLSDENGLYTVTNVVKVNEKDRNSFIKNIDKQQESIAIDRQQMNETFLGLLKNDFNKLINYSLLAIIITIILFFRNFELSLLTMFPIVLTGIVTAGIMYFLGVELNIFSTVVCTLIFGVGDDFSIFLTQAMQKEHSTGKNELPTYRVSIFLAVLTTTLSIGSLIFAKHPALHSLAMVALLGMFSVIAITSILYPFWFRLLITSRQKKGLSPVTLRLLFNTVISFTIYGLGGFFFSCLGHFFIRKAKGVTLDFIKLIIAKFLTFVLYTNPFVRKRVINKVNETFERPAVIIANHTSFLDTLAISMATHKTVFLVNDWVHKSPIFGKLVKALGFFPVSQGIENGIEPLQEKVDQGYSLVIFPEGQRSYDNNVKRFHKGAFYLAEQMKLDIIPMYIHGDSEVQPKGDFIIYDGEITVKVGERIKFDDKNFGANYSEKTKKVNAFFRSEFANLRTELEDENYFKKKLFLSYLYKEKEITKGVKTDFEKNKSVYFELNKHISPDANILHFADDFGQKEALLTLQQAGRRIFCIQKKLENKVIAQQNYIVKNRKINYIESLKEVTKNMDVVLVSSNHFSLENLENQPQKIIVLWDIIQLPENKYECATSLDSIKVYRKKEK